MAKVDIIVAFHARCPDGYGAASAFVNMEKKYSKVHYMPVQYGQTNEKFWALLSELEGKCDVALVDFSFGIEEMNRISASAIRFLWIDHHETAQDILGEWMKSPPTNTHIVFDMTHSGAWLTWNHFNKKIPDIINYVEDRDLWKWNLEHSKEVNASLFFEMEGFSYSETSQFKDAASIVHAMANSNVIGKNKINRHVIAGKILTENTRRMAEHTFKHVFILKVGELEFPASFSTESASGMANYIVKALNRPACIIIPESDGKKWILSFRSMNGLEAVKPVAASLGGGGHPNAAGCSVEWHRLQPREYGYEVCDG